MASGSTIERVLSRTASGPSLAAIIAGNEAIELCVEKAMSWAGKAARAKRPGAIWPNRITSG